MKFALSAAALSVVAHGASSGQRSISCPFTGGESRAPGLPRGAKCNHLGPMYVQGGGLPFRLSAPANGDCVYGVAGGACSSMPLGNIERIEIDLSVSRECQQNVNNCTRKDGTSSKGDWVALWLEPQQLGVWNKNREVDIMETVCAHGSPPSYVATNFDTTGHTHDWGLYAPFAAHVTMTTSTHGGFGVYVAHCKHGSSSCKTGPGVKGNAYKMKMEPEIVYRLVVDNWGNQCSKDDHGTTPGCTLSVDRLDLTLKGAPPVPTPQPSPAQTCSKRGGDCLSNDIGSVAGHSADDCCTKCQNRPGCGAAVFVQGGQYANTCFLKSSCNPTGGCSGDSCTAVIVANTPTPTPSPPAPAPTPGSWGPCAPGNVCCDPHARDAYGHRQVCPSGADCQECGGGNSCSCPAAEEATMVAV